ncbi:MAG: cbb3-type cytochrome c oxidase subunit I [Aigarchaeota archaeon]|nr:cbb3-type cytochrome c oxidase subunit I [Candidatus Calditenuaceae archaeon]
MGSHHLPPTSSLRRWLMTTDHKDVGILYLVTSIYFLVVAGVLALVFRLQLAEPGLNFLSPTAFNQAITIHGLLMILFVISPLAFALANYVVPLQIGARDLAFPRLNALSYWLFLFGGVLVIISFFQERTLDVGWTMYQPLTSAFSPYVGVNTGGLGLALLTASVTVSTVNFVVTIFRSRAKGLRLTALPMFTMSVLLTVLMMLYAFPALLAGIILLASDRLLGTVYFTSPEGGAILWDHIFWFFGHPEVYIVLFPALGVMADTLVTFSRRPLFGRRIIISAMVIVALISFLVWGHHMFLTGIHPDVRRAFVVTTIAISLPFDAIFLSFIYTLSKAKIELRTPMLFTLGSIAIFIIGGITGVFLGSIALDYVLRGTYFVVAHFHYTMAGGGLVGLIAGLYYWYPKMTGRMFSEKLGRLQFILTMIGFNMLYFPLFLAWEMPRRVPLYVESLIPLNQVATIGGFVFGASFLVMFWNLLYSLKYGEPAGENPWGAHTLEWMTKSPPPSGNFEGTPAFVDGRLTFVAANGAAGGEMETHLSIWPLMLSLASFVALLGLTTNILVTTAGLGLLAFSVLGFAGERFISREGELGERWPFDRVDRMKLAWWTFISSEIVLFGVILSAYVYVRTASATWPAPGTLFDIGHGAVNTFVLLTSSLTVALALASSRSGSRAGTVGFLAATLALGAFFLFNKYDEWAELFGHGVTFSSGLPASTFFLTTGIHGAHVFAGLLALVYLLVRALRGAYVRDGHETLEYFGYYWHFVDIVWVFIFPLFYLV